MNEVFNRRANTIPAVPCVVEALLGCYFVAKMQTSCRAHTFRLPSRITLNDSKRQNWFDDLANSAVPLSKLGKNVPHGAKGADLLDLLHAKDVSIPRAVWFLRVFGANETVRRVDVPYRNSRHSHTPFNKGWVAEQAEL